MASGSSKKYSGREKTHFARVSRLLMDIGRRTLQDKFDSFHPPATLNMTLNNPSVSKQLQRLRTGRVLYPQQWSLLYPASGQADSNEFDITLLFLLLRNICGLTAPATGWDNEPLVTDLSLVADLIRIKRFRNMLYAHRVDVALSDDEFESYWISIEAVLNRLGKCKYKAHIERLKFISMDHELDHSFYALLQSWENSATPKVTLVGVIRTLTAGGTFLAWAGGSAYFLNRYKEDPEMVIRIVQEAIIPSGLATSAIVSFILPGSFKIVIEVQTLEALIYIWKSYEKGTLQRNLEQVVINDKLYCQAPDAKEIKLSLEIDPGEYAWAHDILLKEINSEQGKVLPDNEIFDAYICYPFKEREFADEILSKLEAPPYNLKLCVDYRDMMIAYDLKATLDFIETRCCYIIVLISKNFNENRFLESLAVKLSPGSMEKRLIPIVLDDRKYMPKVLRHITHLDWSNLKKDDFWHYLARSIGYKEH